jgi:hypothetical protein
MVENFYDIGELTTEQLKEMFRTYRSRGWVDFDYYDLMPEGVIPPQLPDELILRNINGDNEMNMFVYMLDHEDEQDGIMIGFGLTEYPDFGAYLHLDKSLLDGIITEYNLKIKPTGEIPFQIRRDDSVN